MRQYYIGITRTYQVVMVLVFAPLIGVPVIVLGAMYGPSLPQWAALTAIYSLMGIGIISAFVLIKKVQHKAILTMTDDGFTVDFEERNMFTPQPFEVKMSQVEQVKVGGRENLYYLSFSTTVYPYGFNAEGRSKRDEDQAAFYEVVEAISKMYADKEEKNKLSS